MTERLLLALTVLGFVVPNVLLGIFIAAHGLDLSGYFSLWTDSTPSTQLALDLGIARACLLRLGRARGTAGADQALVAVHPGRAAGRTLLRPSLVPLPARARA